MSSPTSDINRLRDPDVDAVNLSQVYTVPQLSITRKLPQVA
jgi:hypothetical protein